MFRLIAWLLASIMAMPAIAAPGLVAGTFNEFKVELPDDLRKSAGRGALSPVTHARVTIAAPPNFDPARTWPVVVISATTDRGYSSSRSLLREYAESALASGWVAVAADPAEAIPAEQDGVPLRLALNTVAVAVVALQWPGADKAALAFGGFSGGAKISGWLAAAFASRGRNVIGVYQSGCNENTVAEGMSLFGDVNATFKRTPVFLVSGDKDPVAKPGDHDGIAADLKRAGFRNVRVERFPGAHDTYPPSMRVALDWFRELAALPATAR